MKKFTALLAFLLLGASAARAQLTATFVDVGQGDAIYIELPNGHNALIDGGPNGESIRNFLKSKGVTKIDHVVLTHPHSDHYIGLLEVFKKFQVNEFYDTRMNNTDAQGDDTLRQLAQSEPGCRTIYPEPGDQLNWDRNVTVKVLNSCTSPVSSKDNTPINNCSIVLRLFYNGNGILLMGDAETEIENAMMRIFKSGLNSTYLKVGHHGSRYSTSAKFLERVQPRVAIISVGQDNKFGHPHKETLDRLMAAKIQVFTTLDGTQTLTIPAPKRGVEPMVNGEIELPVVYTPTPEFRMQDYPYNPADAAAMKQLGEAASK
ncbi:MAG: ComEC/Rec2 family competence protein [Elusimicrobia bacterium]|nr:ComEC/Rec2 family competence protein [Elusimicrobiota bacterium]